MTTSHLRSNTARALFLAVVSLLLTFSPMTALATDYTVAINLAAVANPGDGDSVTGTSPVTFADSRIQNCGGTDYGLQGEGTSDTGSLHATANGDTEFCSAAKTTVSIAFDDLIFTSPSGSLFCPTLNLVVDGSIPEQTSAHIEVQGRTAQNNQFFRFEGDWAWSSPTGNGMLSGVPHGTSSMITTPAFCVPHGTPYSLTIIASTGSGEDNTSTVHLSFPTIGDVFNMPGAGYTVDSVSGNIVDNQWQGVGEPPPPPPVPALSRGALLGLAVLLGGWGWAMRSRVWRTT